MTKLDAMRIAKKLIEAVESGVITEVQAKNRFKVIAYKYKQKEIFMDLQISNPRLWMTMGSLLRSNK